MQIYIDGSSLGQQFGKGHRKAHIAVLVPGREIVEECGDITNNQAEYLALIRSLEYAIEKGVSEAEIFSDSEFMVEQMNGRYRVKSKNIMPYYYRAVDLAKKIPNLLIKWVPRDDNPAGDVLENLNLIPKDSIKKCESVIGDKGPLDSFF